MASAFIIKTIKLLPIILGVIFGFGCNRLSESEQPESFPFGFLDSIQSNELGFLKGVYIGTRQQGEFVDRFYVTSEKVSYHLPIYNSFKTKEKIMNPDWYDVAKFAKSKNLDSLNPYDYVKTYTDKVLSIYIKSKALNIKSDSSLGDFIILEYPNQQIIYKFPNGQIFHPFWKEYFAKAKEVKKDWFIEH